MTGETRDTGVARENSKYYNNFKGNRGSRENRNKTRPAENDAANEGLF